VGFAEGVGGGDVGCAHEDAGEVGVRDWGMFGLRIIWWRGDLTLHPGNLGL
jgi:hypothetical protein